MLNIVIPMAGRGSRFSEAGYSIPKPLIQIQGKHMIEGVIDNIKPSSIDCRFIFICQMEHIKEFDIEKKLKQKEPGSIVIPINYVTEGAACTVLLAEEHIDNESPLMIANSDQWIDLDIDDYINFQINNKLDGLIMTMEASDPKWSYVKLSDSKEKVTYVVEKKVVSNEATVGIYNFSSGSDFCKHARLMIENDDRVNGEFYVAPVYNSFIESNKNIGIYNIGSESKGMYGIGTPEDLEYFLNDKVSLKF